MTNGEKEAIKAAAEHIKRLASLDNAGFDFNKKTDEYIKEKISPYMTWFDLVADELEQLANAENGFEKKCAIAEIIRNNY